MIAKRELRRFAAADLRSTESGDVLSARELSKFERICRDAGMPELPDVLPYSKWGEYLEVFNKDADARGWWAALIPPKDPQRAMRIARVIAEEEHRKLLARAIAGGEIQARMAGTMTPAPPGLVNLTHLVLTRDGLEAFAALLAMRVEEMPHFVHSPRPLEVPSALLALPDDARVFYEDRVGGQHGSTITSAADYRSEIQKTIARQAEGHFTLNEAAQVLADSRSGLGRSYSAKRP